MINKIKLIDVASYSSEEAVEIEGLKRVNFFFGNNGTGKSTIARLLYNTNLSNEEQDHIFEKCAVDGFDRRNDEILVFDDHFCERNFIQRNRQKGIFSLDETNEEIDQLIDKAENKIEQFETHQNNVLEGRKQWINRTKEKWYEDLKDHCFKTRKTVVSSFLKIKDDFPNKRHQNNYDKIINTLAELNEVEKPIEFDSLIQRYKDLYDKKISKIDISLDPKDYRKIRRCEEKLNQILDEVIVGNKDVDIAKLIDRIEIQSFVKDGFEIIKKNPDTKTCPFCQEETIDQSIREKFETYFDETYQEKLDEIDLLKNKYFNLMHNYLGQIVSLKEEFNPDNLVSVLYERIKRLYEENDATIASKLKKSNEKKSIGSLLQFKSQIVEVNSRIKSNNQNFDNLDESKEIFIEDIWLYISQEREEEVTAFDNRQEQFGRILTLIEVQQSKLQNDIDALRTKIEKWREETKTTKNAVEQINKILRNSGFEGFEILESGKSDRNIAEYYIKRDSGENEDVYKSLSEGEKNFISFLYFFQLCKGTDDLEKGSKNKIIVIDDPVSSMDSQVLFITNSLIQRLISRNSSNKGMLQNGIEQVYIFTHNVFFYKEISFKENFICSQTKHYSIIKTKNRTKVIDKGKKPFIKSDYAMLWDSLKEMKATDSGQVDIALYNTTRRILETFMSFAFGESSNDWSILDKIDEDTPEYVVVYSLLSEINGSSHKTFPFDSVYYQKVLDKSPEDLFNAFKLIFKEIGKEHYESMMGEPIVENAETDLVTETIAQSNTQNNN